MIWGGLHGLYLVVNHGWRAARRRFLPGLPGGTAWERVAGIGVTFIAVVIAWVFFRAGSFDGASDLLAGMFGFHGLLVPARYADRLGALLPALQHAGVLRAGEIPLFDGARKSLALALLFVVVWAMPNTIELMRRYRPTVTGFESGPAAEGVAWRLTPAWGLATAVVAYLALLPIMATRSSEFLYFQF